MQSTLIGPLALVASAGFAFAGLYITVAEQPARLALDDNKALLAQWQPSFNRGKMMQPTLALLSASLGFLEWRRTQTWQFAAGASLMLSVIPYTYFLLVGINAKLLATPVKDANSGTRDLIVQWGNGHFGRVVLSLLATGAFLWGLEQRGTQ
jgi:uncharacterized membrane protein (DUF485 family)